MDRRLAAVASTRVLYWRRLLAVHAALGRAVLAPSFGTWIPKALDIRNKNCARIYQLLFDSEAKAGGAPL